MKYWELSDQQLHEALSAVKPGMCTFRINGWNRETAIAMLRAILNDDLHPRHEGGGLQVASRSSGEDNICTKERHHGP